MATITIGRKLNSAQDSVTAVQGAAGSSPWTVKDAAQLVGVPYDRVELSYSGRKVTQAVYKQGGATVATLTMTYSGSKLTAVTRT
jgi:hypothetical protein